MKLHLKILLISLTCIFAITSNASSNERVPLWGSTYYGMSLKEVLLIQSNAKTKPDNIKTLLLNPNEQALAKLDNIEIAGETFNAWFIFNDDKLSKVKLILLPKVNGTGTSMSTDYFNALYNQYSLLLISKYGNPAIKTWQDYAPLNIHLWSAEWIFGFTSISLKSEKSELEITYSAQYADDLRKL